MLAPNEELRDRLGFLQWLRVEMQWETDVLSVQRHLITLLEAGEPRCLTESESAESNELKESRSMLTSKEVSHV
jgi:hypothetical protein